VTFSAQPTDTAVLHVATVGHAGGVAVGCGSFVDRVFTLADGTTARGLTAILVDVVADTRVVVGLGSTVWLGGVRWRVSRLTTEDPCARVTSSSSDSVLLALRDLGENDEAS